MNDPILFLSQLTELYRTSVPSLQDVAEQFLSLPTADVSLLLQEDQRLRQQYSCSQPVEQYIQVFADRIDQTAQIDLIYHDFLLKEEAGSAPSTEDYLLRFPAFRDELQRQFELHRVLVGQPDGSTEEPHAAVTLATRSASDIRLPRIEGFEIEGILGNGAMGVVYQAMDCSLKRSVAIKMLRAGSSAQVEEVRRLRNEAEAVARLRHPNIVTLYQIGDHLGQPFLVMQLVKGETLSSRLRSGPLSVDKALLIIEPICDAIHAANSESVIHRDLKPANILLDEHGVPFVTDFGLARLVSNDPAVSGNVVGTPQYMSPEQARGETIGPESDVYSLGVVLFEMLTGRPPFQAASAWDVISQILQRDVPHLRDLNSTIPLDLQTICEKCLEKNPSRRYASAKELRDDLVRFREQRPILARPANPLSKLWKWCRRNVAVASLLSLTAVLLVGIAVGSLLSVANLAKANKTIRDQTDRALKAESEALKDRAAVVQSFNSLVDELYEELSSKTGTMPQRDAIIRTSLTGLKTIANRSADRDIDTNLIIALLRMGDLQFLSGQDEDAQQSFSEAIKACEVLLKDAPREFAVRMHLATALNSSGAAWYRSGKMNEAQGALERCRDVLVSLIADFPDEPEPVVLAVSTSSLLTDILWVARGDHLKSSEDGIKFADLMLKSFPDAKNATASAALAYQRNGRAYVEANQLGKGIEQYNVADGLLTKHSDAHPEDDDARSTLFVNRRLLANALAMSGRVQEALSVIATVIRGMTELSDADPRSVPRANQVVLAYLSEALIHEANADFASVRESLTRGKRECEESMVLNPKTTQFTSAYCQMCLQLAMLDLEFRGDWSAAENELNDYHRAVNGDGVRPAVSPEAMAPYLPTLKCIEEPIRRGNGNWSSEPTNDGTSVLLAYLGLIDVTSGASELTSDALAQIRQKTGEELPQGDYASLFARAHSLAEQPMPRTFVFLCEAISFGRLGELAESVGDLEGRMNHLNAAIEALRRFRNQLPELYSAYAMGDSRLKWVLSTPEFQQQAPSEK